MPNYFELVNTYFAVPNIQQLHQHLCSPFAVVRRVVTCREKHPAGVHP